jgi:hypothetical protein
LTYALANTETWITIQAESSLEISANVLSLGNVYSFVLTVTEPISGTVATSPLTVTLINLCETATVIAKPLESQILYSWNPPLTLNVPFVAYQNDI